MRHVATALFVLGLGITAMVPSAFAQVDIPPNGSFINEYGNQIVPLTNPGGGGGAVCYMDGAAYSCTQAPAPTLQTAPTGSAGTAGTVAGGPMICPVFGACYEPPYTGGNR